MNNTCAMCENKPEPLAKTRSRRSNAGARMHEMMFAAEDDELFAQTYGGLLKAEDDSSDDEEYIPKDIETVDGDEVDFDEDEDEDDEGNNDEDEVDDEDDDDDDEDDDDDCSSGGGSSPIDANNDESNSSRMKSRIKPKNAQNNLREASIASPCPVNYTNLKHDKTLIQPGSPSQVAYESCAKICCVCLGDQSGEDDEVIECDACGVSVHESCYGVSEEDVLDDALSNHSNISSDSTEPWFCEACRRSVRNPTCELCPNSGGIFKQTDTGRWVHMVCALYTRGVTFENINTLTEVSLFELSPTVFGSKVSKLDECEHLTCMNRN